MLLKILIFNIRDGIKFHKILEFILEEMILDFLIPLVKKKIINTSLLDIILTINQNYINSQHDKLYSIFRKGKKGASVDQALLLQDNKTLSPDN